MAEYVGQANGVKTDSEGHHKFQSQLFTAGVPTNYATTSLKVVQRGAGANMSIDVSIGMALLITPDLKQSYDAWIDAAKNVAVTVADATNPRIDRVVAWIDPTTFASASNNSPGSFKFSVIAGTPAASPTAPTDSAVQTALGTNIAWVPLASILVAAGAANITNAVITDTRKPITSTAAASTSATGGYTDLGVVPTTVTYNGNRSYDLTFNSVDLTSVLSNHMRIKTTRTVTALAQCANLNGTTQFFNRATTINGMVFTNGFVTGAWVKLSAYSANPQIIVSRFNNTNGWDMGILSDGTVYLQGHNGLNNYSYIQGRQSLPLNKWVHVASQLDMAAFTNSPTTSYVMFDGADVPSVPVRAGTNPTALIQGGNIEVGTANGGLNPIAGKLAQVFITSAKLTQAQVRTIYSQGITSGDVTSLSIASAYSLSGASGLVDINTTNANNLTANGAATTTASDAPWTQDDTTTPSGTTDFAIVTKKVFSTNTTITIQVPEGCTIPTSGGVATVSYANAKVPYGFPADRGKWVVASLFRAGVIVAMGQTWTNVGSYQLITPVGAWRIRYKGIGNCQTSNTVMGSALSATSGSSVPVASQLVGETYTSSGIHYSIHAAEDSLQTTTITPLYLNVVTNNVGATAGWESFYGSAYIEAEPAGV